MSSGAEVNGGHRFTIEGFSIVPFERIYEAHAVRAAIIVEPPITVGEGLYDAVVGPQLGINLRHIISTTECTVFTAEVALRSRADGEQNIHIMAERIIALANNPAMVNDRGATGLIHVSDGPMIKWPH